MTRWGIILLLVFVALGLSKKPESKAMTIGVWVTAIVITFVMAKTVR